MARLYKVLPINEKGGSQPGFGISCTEQEFTEEAGVKVDLFVSMEETPRHLSVVSRTVLVG